MFVLHSFNIAWAGLFHHLLIPKQNHTVPLIPTHEWGGMQGGGWYHKGRPVSLKFF
jgi:hypothetical protein